jgi:hypothetical protein
MTVMVLRHQVNHFRFQNVDVFSKRGEKTHKYWGGITDRIKIGDPCVCVSVLQTKKKKTHCFPIVCAQHRHGATTKKKTK